MAWWLAGHPALVQHNFYDPPAIVPKEFDTQRVKLKKMYRKRSCAREMPLCVSKRGKAMAYQPRNEKNNFTGLYSTYQYTFKYNSTYTSILHHLTVLTIQHIPLHIQIQHHLITHPYCIISEY